MSPTTQGMLLMVLAGIVLTLMHVLVRYLGSDMHAFEISFFRNLFGLVAILPVIYKAGLASIRPTRPGLQLVRSILGTIAMLTWFYALTIVPVAEATALSFCYVLFASIGAIFVLGEKMRLRRWTAVGFGFIGALVILRPGFHEISVGLLLVLLSSICWGTAVVVVKNLSKTDSVISIVTWMAVLLTIFSFFPALMVWRQPTLVELGWLLMIGVLGTTGHLAMTRALKLADATSILPLDFSRLLWAALFGYAVFGEAPDRWVWLGGAIIIASATYLIFREARVKRARGS